MLSKGVVWPENWRNPRRASVAEGFLEVAPGTPGGGTVLKKREPANAGSREERFLLGSDGFLGSFRLDPRSSCHLDSRGTGAQSLLEPRLRPRGRRLGCRRLRGQSLARRTVHQTSSLFTYRLLPTGAAVKECNGEGEETASSESPQGTARATQTSGDSEAHTSVSLALGRLGLPR